MAKPESEKDIPFNVPGKKKSSRKAPTIGHAGNVEFEQLDKANLQAVPVVVQALDNQWLPQGLLKSVFKKGKITPAIDKNLNRFVRSEYIRSLLNGQQVILNRAYLYNSPVIAQDYAGKKNPMRSVFKRFLEEETIVPCLLGEKTPVDLPHSGPGTVSGYGVTKEFSEWQKLCQEVRTRCLRLSWDDQENSELVRKYLALPFNTFATSAGLRDIDTYIHDLGLDPSARNAFRRRLTDVGRFCLDLADQDQLVTRNQVYQEFITATENTAERKYDGSKPFAAELKQLFDLSYNCNLPDALGGYLLTPVDSLPRTTLQEWQPMSLKQEINGEEIVKLLQRTAFSLVQSGLNLPSMDVLSLQDVAEIRHMEEWTGYMERLKYLLASPLDFADGGIAHVYESYGAMTQRVTELLARQAEKRRLLHKWSPSVEIVFNIAGAVLTYFLTPAGPVFQLAGAVAGSIAGGAVPVVGKLIIRDLDEKHAQQDLSTSVDFMRYRMQDAVRQWKEIEKPVHTLPNFQEVSPSIEHTEIVDPTLSYQEADN